MQENWIIPCNAKYFNVIERFQSFSWAIWKKANRGINVGDIAYIYVGAPYSQILFKCEVVDDNVDKKTVAENDYAIQKEGLNGIDYIKIELRESYAPGTLSLQNLKKHGLGQVQTQARADRRLAAYLAQIKGTPFSGGDKTHA